MVTRRVVASVGLAVLLVTSGCVGFLTGSEPLAFESNPVSVSEAARSEAGYEVVSVGPRTVERSFTAAGTTHNVTVTNHVAEYQRQVSLGPLGESPFARFTVLSSPGVEVAGQAFNPLADLSDRELVTRLQSQYDSIDDVRFRSNRTVEILGEERTVSRFDATTTVGGREVDLAVHVATFRHDGDYLAAVAVHPARLDGEAARVDAMFGGVRHPTNATDTDA